MTEQERRAATLERVMRRAKRLIRDGDEVLADKELWDILYERNLEEWDEPVIDVGE